MKRTVKNRTMLESVTSYLSGRKTPATLKQVQNVMRGKCAISTIQRVLSKLVLRNAVTRDESRVNGRNLVTFSIA